MENYEISKFLNDPVVSKFATKKIGRSRLFIKLSIFCQHKNNV